MSSPLEGWDLKRYRGILCERASRLKRDPRVRVAFDESDLTQDILVNALKAEQMPEGLTDDEKRLSWLLAIQDSALIDLQRKQDLQSLRQALQESARDAVRLALGAGCRAERGRETP